MFNWEIKLSPRATCALIQMWQDLKYNAQGKCSQAWDDFLKSKYNNACHELAPVLEDFAVSNEYRKSFHMKNHPLVGKSVTGLGTYADWRPSYRGETTGLVVIESVQEIPGYAGYLINDKYAMSQGAYNSLVAADAK